MTPTKRKNPGQRANAGTGQRLPIGNWSVAAAFYFASRKFLDRDLHTLTIRVEQKGGAR